MDTCQSYTWNLHQALLELTNPKIWFYEACMNQISGLCYCWVNLIKQVSENANPMTSHWVERQYSAKERVSLIEVTFLSLACKGSRQFPPSLIHGRQWKSIMKTKYNFRILLNTVIWSSKLILLNGQGVHFLLICLWTTQYLLQLLNSATVVQHKMRSRHHMTKPVRFVLQ